jgi:hypothetical protein
VDDHREQHLGKKAAHSNGREGGGTPKENSVGKMVQVASYWYEYEAQQRAAFLRQEGIRVHVQGEMMGTLFWHYNNATGGIRLFVSPEDARRAEELLESPPEHPFQAMPFDAEEEETPKSKEARELEEKVSQGDARARRALYAAVFGMLFFAPFAIVAIWEWYRSWEFPLSVRGRRYRRWAVFPALIGTVGTVLLVVFLVMGLWMLGWELLPDPMPWEGRKRF